MRSLGNNTSLGFLIFTLVEKSARATRQEVALLANKNHMSCKPKLALLAYLDPSSKDLFLKFKGMHLSSLHCGLYLALSYEVCAHTHTGMREHHICVSTNFKLSVRV